MKQNQLTCKIYPLDVRAFDDANDLGPHDSKWLSGERVKADICNDNKPMVARHRGGLHGHTRIYIQLRF